MKKHRFRAVKPSPVSLCHSWFDFPHPIRQLVYTHRPEALQSCRGAPLMWAMMDLGTLATVMQPQSAWLPVVILIVIGILFGVGTLTASFLIGPRRTGAIKETTYESGMTPIADTRKRFNARFYIVAMIFVVFDVEIVFFYPWATLFPRAAEALQGLLLAEMAVFILILLVAYVYAWGKGVFSWE